MGRPALPAHRPPRRALVDDEGLGQRQTQQQATACEARAPARRAGCRQVVGGQHVQCKLVLGVARGCVIPTRMLRQSAASMRKLCPRRSGQDNPCQPYRGADACESAPQHCMRVSSPPLTSLWALPGGCAGCSGELQLRLRCFCRGGARRGVGGALAPLGARAGQRHWDRRLQRRLPCDVYLGKLCCCAPCAACTSPAAQTRLVAMGAAARHTPPSHPHHPAVAHAA